MMILKKKEIIAAALVVLIGMAGYLNWSYQDMIHVTDGDSYIETGKTLGEAQYVSAVDEVEETEDEESEETVADEENDATGEATDGDEDEDEDAKQDGVTVETATDDGGYFSQAKLNKEASRAKSLEILNQTASNESFDQETRQKAGDQIIAIAGNVEKESEIESIAQSKGYEEVCVFVDENEANVMVRKEGFGKEDVVKLTEIVTEQLKNSAKNVKIVEVK